MSVRSSATASVRRVATLAAATARPTTERDRERRRIAIMCLPFFALATVAGFVPLAMLVRISLAEETVWIEGWSLEAWRTLATTAEYRWVAWNTLWFVGLATLVSVALGVAVSHVLEKYELPFERAVVAAVSFPIALPGIIVAYLIIVLLGRQGLVTNAIAVATGQSALDLASATAITGLFLGYVYSLLPRATMVLRGTYAEVNVQAEEAARALGASRWQTFYHVTFPEIRPGIVAAAILTFRSGLAIFGTVLILQSHRVLTLQIHDEISVGSYDPDIAAAIGLVYVAFIVAVTFVGLRFIENEAVEI
ncbi:ABC transporter permease [Natrinema altunense]|uniref:Binding-protein-dependent transport systems inner membrane component n=1 Tax=Natrinema altunense (strain JCM 12890 / CGMCC 1.3731 / AJ2) TaxID=1227494 RepID=L9ZAP9_NATA2|nr:ABC transporter permease subunit [Natrinema altunense]ELY83535.1 binding-protein-dependent transport systems inner membrane component [Natrinema altunense JCM 12890]